MELVAKTSSQQASTEPCVDQEAVGTQAPHLAVLLLGFQTKIPGGIPGTSVQSLRTLWQSEVSERVDRTRVRQRLLRRDTQEPQGV